MSHEGRTEEPNPKTAAPRYRYSARPFAPPSEHCAMLIQVRRVDGDPDGGPLGLRTSSQGDPLDVVLGELRDLLSQMRAFSDGDGAS